MVVFITIMLMLFYSYLFPSSEEKETAWCGVVDTIDKIIDNISVLGWLDNWI